MYRYILEKNSLFFLDCTPESLKQVPLILQFVIFYINYKYIFPYTILYFVIYL